MSGNALFDYLVGVAAIVSLILYLIELYKRKTQDKLMLGFLHGIKPLIESMATTPTITTGPVWQKLLSQINDMLARLQ